MEPVDVNVVTEMLVQYGIDCLLRSQFKFSKWALDCAVYLRPEISPTLWQRGLACYYAGSYEEGVFQFEADMKVNGNDAEEVLWHFLCRCKLQGFEKATAAGFLPLSHSSMVTPPMEAVLNLFQHKECVTDVLMASIGKDGTPLKSYNDTNALAYAHFYIGLYMEARGELKGAEEHLRTAAAMQNPDFMGKLMSVHYQHFSRTVYSKLRSSITKIQLGRSGHGYPYHLSRVIQGGWQLSEGHSLNGHSRTRVEAVEDLLYAHSQGITAFDCGDIYTGVEQLYGSFLTAHRLTCLDPEEIAIHTKLVPDLEVIQQKGVDDDYVRAVVRRSMNRLGVGCLHLVQLHWWDMAIPGYVEAARAIVRLQEEGIVKQIGLTNFDTRHTEEILAANIPIASVQVQYSLLDNRPDASQLVALCEKHSIKILAYGVLAGGFLTDIWLGKELPSREMLTNRSLVKYLPMIEEFGGWELFQELLCVLHGIAGRHGTVMTADGSHINVTIAMVAMQYVLTQKQVGAIIIGSHDGRYLKETVASQYLTLTDQDLAEIACILAKSSFSPGSVYGLERNTLGPHGRIMRYNLNQVNKGQHVEELCRRYLELHFSAYPVDATRAGYRFSSTLGYKRWICGQCSEGFSSGDRSVDTFPLYAAQSSNFDHFLCLSGSNAIRNHCAKVSSMIVEAEGICQDSISVEQLVDLKIIISQLHLQLVTFEKLKPQTTNPNYYLPFESLNYLLPSWGSMTTDRDSVACSHPGVVDMSVGERLVALLQRLRAMTYLIRNGEADLINPSTIFVETALKTCRSFLHYLASDLPGLCCTLAGMDTAMPPGGYDIILGELRIVSKAVWACVTKFTAFLSQGIQPLATKVCGCGLEAYSQVLKYWHFIDSPEGLLSLGERHFDQIKKELEALAKEIDPNKTWKDIIKDVMIANHPKSPGLLNSYMLEIERARAHMISKELVFPLPPGEKVIGLYTPKCLVPFSPFGDFLNPPPFAGMGLDTSNSYKPSSHECGRVGILMLHSVAAMGLSAEEEDRLLQSHDYTWISVIAPHETYPGHHVQALAAQAHPRILRRFYESPLFYEGWGLYTEELAYETGFFENQTEVDRDCTINSSMYAKLARLTQLKLRLWRAARVILDVKLNTGRLSFEQCQDFLHSELMFNPLSSAGEVLMYATRPGYAPCYVAGFTSLMKLRAEFEHKEGTRFSLKHFHDNLLSRGCVPFKLLELLLN